MKKSIYSKTDYINVDSWASLGSGGIKNLFANAGDLGSIPGLGRSPGEGKGYPLQFSGLENYMDCIVQGVAKSRTQLRDFHFHLQSQQELCMEQKAWMGKGGSYLKSWLGH